MSIVVLLIVGSFVLYKKSKTVVCEPNRFDSCICSFGPYSTNEILPCDIYSSNLKIHTSKPYIVASGVSALLIVFPLIVTYKQLKNKKTK